MDYNQIKRKRKSIRLQGYNYSQAGLYFVTICSLHQECIFGHIHDGEMILNAAGQAANNCWLDISTHFPHAILHEHVIMPNHVHGIIELTNGVGAKNFSPCITAAHNCQGAKGFSPLNFITLYPLYIKTFP